MNENLHILEIFQQLGIEPTDVQTLRNYPPITRIANGESTLHDDGHVARVVLYANMLCSALEAQGQTVNRHAVLSAIRIHDSHREGDDEAEQYHGQHAADYARSAGIFDDDKDAELILQLAQWHSVDDNVICQRLGFVFLPIEYQILKDADALDWVRDLYHEPQGQGLDEGYLRTDQSRLLVPVAQELCRQYYWVDHHEHPMEAVIAIGIEMGIIS